MIETQHFPIALVHLATCILVERLRQQTLNTVTNAYLRLQLVVNTPIQKFLCLCCKKKLVRHHKRRSFDCLIVVPFHLRVTETPLSH